MEIKLKFKLSPMTKARAEEIAERKASANGANDVNATSASASADNAHNAHNAHNARLTSNDQVATTPNEPKRQPIAETPAPTLSQPAQPHKPAQLAIRGQSATERQLAISRNNVRVAISQIKESSRFGNVADKERQTMKLMNNLNVAYDKEEVHAKVQTQSVASKPAITPIRQFTFKLPNKIRVATTTTASTATTSADTATTAQPAQSASTTNQSSSPATTSLFQWDESQLSAINNIIENQFNCLIGAAGSGKTTVVKEVISRLQSLSLIKPMTYTRCNNKTLDGYNIAFVSFTGKAVEQLRKSVPSSLQTGCMTIHNLLEYAPVFEDYVDENGKAKQRKIFLPRRDELNPLPHDIIVIDESGMVGVELWNNLWKALVQKPSLKIILIGDINQLPAVIGKSVLGYALASPKWKTSTLTKIHRQALDNPIIANAHRIIAGKMPVADPAKPNFKLVDIGSLSNDERERVRSRKLPFDYYDKKNTEINGYKSVLSLVNLLYRNSRYDPARDQIIVPQNTGLLGQESLNRKLAEIFNPAPRTFIRAGIETKFLAIGDKVMFTSNDYASGILNGMTGYIKDIQLNASYTGFAEISREVSNANAELRDNSARLAEIQAHAAQIDLDELVESATSNDSAKQEVEQQASHSVTVAYTPIGSDTESTITISSVGALRGLFLAYAITCHKAQGSEYRNVIVVCHSASNSLLSREWLYTAVTRARETLFLVYNDYSARGISKALRRQVIEGATIEEKAKNFSLAEAQAKSAKATGDDDNNVLVPQGV